MTDPKILYLSLRKEPFEVMRTGEKSTEYRKPSKWILSRLYNKNGSPKQYDLVKFTNGYGSDKPYFMVGFNYFSIAQSPFEIEYSNELLVKIESQDICIMLSKVICVGNDKNVSTLKQNK